MTTLLETYEGFDPLSPDFIKKANVKVVNPQPVTVETDRTFSGYISRMKNGIKNKD